MNYDYEYIILKCRVVMQKGRDGAYHHLDLVHQLGISHMYQHVIFGPSIEILTVPRSSLWEPERRRLLIKQNERTARYPRTTMRRTIAILIGIFGTSACR